MDRWLGNELLEALEDRRRVLKALPAPFRSHHQRNEWQLGVLAELLFRARVANQPLMRDPLVSEVGADLDGIGRELVAVDGVGRHSRSLAHLQPEITGGSRPRVP